MNSCVASSCTCSPQVSCAFAILVSWPIGDVPLSCRYAFTCLTQHKNRRQIKMPLIRTVFGVVPSVADRWWLSKGSPLPRSHSGLHRCSLLPHETLLSNPHPARLSACSISLRLNAEQNSILNFLSASSTILSCPSLFPASSAVLYRTVSATLHTAVSSHSISIGPASAATASGFLLAALIERAQSYMPTFTALPKRASD